MFESLLRNLLVWFGLLVSAAVGNPIPEEVLIASAGVWAASNAADYHGWQWLVLPVVIAGAVVADIGLYSLGRFFGARLLEHRWFCRLAPPSKREKVRANFQRYGVLILVFGRLVPGIRTTLFLTAGMMRLSIARFCLADGIGALIGNSVIFLLGYLLGSQFQDMLASFEDKMRSSAKPIILLALAVAAIGYVLYRTLRKPIPTGGPEEVPIIGPQVASRIIRKPVPDPCAEENPAVAVADAVLPGGSDDAKEARGTQSPSRPG